LGEIIQHLPKTDTAKIELDPSKRMKVTIFQLLAELNELADELLK